MRGVPRETLAAQCDGAVNRLPSLTLSHFSPMPLSSHRA